MCFHPWKKMSDLNSLKHILTTDTSVQTCCYATSNVASHVKNFHIGNNYAIWTSLILSYLFSSYLILFLHHKEIQIKKYLQNLQSVDSIAPAKWMAQAMPWFHPTIPGGTGVKGGSKGGTKRGTRLLPSPNDLLNLSDLISSYIQNQEDIYI